MAEYSFRYDEARQRFYIQFGGFFREAQADEAINALEKAMVPLPAKFDVVTDLSGFKPASPGVAKGFKRAAEMVKARGRQRGVRVAGKVVTGLLQFKREMSGVFDEDSTRYAATVEEADRMLDDW